MHTFISSVRGQVVRGVLEQLRWFAGKQIKSVACIGGNIITASPISDLNPVFMASGAKLTIVSRGELPRAEVRKELWGRNVSQDRTLSGEIEPQVQWPSCPEV